ncbi:hypothetical protein D9M71_766580 [compost metagenome]
MNERFDDPIVEVIEVASEETANDYLDRKWVLLSTGFTHVKEGKDTIGIFVYSLGRPQSVRNPERDQAIIDHNMRRIMGDSYQD